MREKYKIRIESEHENKLEKKYELFLKHKKTQAIILSQANGIVAAAVLGPPVCSRIHGFGPTMVLQQCAFKTISLTVVEKQFESQPYFTYAEEIFTIGMDGRCIHPYFDCFCKSHYMNFNNFLNNATNSSVLKGLEKKTKKIFRHS
jgi:hypothetical protein